MRRAVSLLALMLAAATLLPAQEKTLDPHAGCTGPSGESVDPAMLERPTTIRADAGKVTQKISAKSPSVQAFYDQGLAYLHSYVWIEAARSFHQALREDSDCAMAWMGLARAEQGLNRDAASKAAIEKAKSLETKVSESERRHIELRAQQIDAQLAPADKEKEKHESYKRAIEKAIAADPSDAELWILRGNAEEPGPWGRGQAGGIGAIAFYEAALARYPGHLGAHHYLVHAYENIGRHADAAEHGKIYASAAPGVAHAQHMYGHVLPRLGRWKEALAQFEKADAIEKRPTLARSACAPETTGTTSITSSSSATRTSGSGDSTRPRRRSGARSTRRSATRATAESRPRSPNTCSCGAAWTRRSPLPA